MGSLGAVTPLGAPLCLRYCDATLGSPIVACSPLSCRANNSQISPPNEDYLPKFVGTCRAPQRRRWSIPADQVVSLYLRSAKFTTISVLFCLSHASSVR